MESIDKIIKIQAWWRQQCAQKKTRKFRIDRPWAVVKMQSAVRIRIARKCMYRRIRMHNLKMYNISQMELLLMRAEEEVSQTWAKELVAGSLLLNAFRRWKVHRRIVYRKRFKHMERAWQFFTEFRINDILVAKERRKDREILRMFQEVMATQIQGQIRRCLALQVLRRLKYERFRHQKANQLQAFFRGKLARQNCWAARRLHKMQEKVKLRRGQENWLLRKVGITSRPNQWKCRELFRSWGFDMNTFSFSLVDLMKESLEDRKHCIPDKLQISSLNITSIKAKALNHHFRTKPSTDVFDKFEKFQFKKGDAVQIILPDHEYYGLSGEILGFYNSKLGGESTIVMQIKIDFDRSMCNILKWTPENPFEEARCNIRKVSREAIPPINAVAVSKNQHNLLLAAAGLRIRYNKMKAALKIQSWCRVRAAIKNLKHRRSIHLKLLAEQPSKIREELKRLGMQDEDAVRMLTMIGIINPQFAKRTSMQHRASPMDLLSEFMRNIDVQRQRHRELARKFERRRHEASRLQTKSMDLLEEEGGSTNDSITKAETILLRARWKTGPRVAIADSINWVKDNVRMPLGDHLRSLSKMAESTSSGLPRSSRMLTSTADFIGKRDDDTSMKGRHVWVQHYVLQELTNSPSVYNEGHCLYHGVWGGDEYVPNGEGVAELLDGPLHLDALICNGNASTRKCFLTPGGSMPLEVRVVGGDKPYKYQWWHYSDVCGRNGTALRQSWKMKGETKKLLNINERTLRKSNINQSFCVACEFTDERYPLTPPITSPLVEVVMALPLCIAVRSGSISTWCKAAESNVHVTAGASIILDIKIEGGAKPYSCSWEKVGEELPEIYTISSSDDSSRFIKESAAKTYDGTYTCTVTDAGGGSFCQRFLVIVSPSLVFLRNLHDHQMSVGSSHSLEVMMRYGVRPYRYEWWRNGELLPEEKRPRSVLKCALCSDWYVFNLSCVGNRIDFTEASAEDAGTYTCVVRDAGGGIVESNRALLVIFPQLRLRIFAAKDLKAVGWQSNPYAVMKLGSRFFVSTVAHGTCNPIWKESFVISVDSIDQKLSITLYHEESNGEGTEEYKDLSDRSAHDINMIVPQ
jgi:hypothetical protein